VDENTACIASVYAELTLAVIRRPYWVYDRRMVRRDVLRLVVAPLLLFVCVSAGVFTLTKLHLAKPEAATPANVTLGDAQRGATVFASTCAACHGQAGRGGGIGPRLAGAQISIFEVKAQIDAGGGAMPAGLVTGRREEDVLAYVATLIAGAKG
jgi:mono/diheme cytochrome c family protein